MKHFLNSDIGEIRIFSRDEKKQDDMRKAYNNEKLKFYIGDIRNLDSIMDAFKGVDYVRTDNTKITDDQITEVKAYAKRLMTDLKKKHGSTSEFYTEFAFKSKYLTLQSKTTLKISCSGQTNFSISKSDLSAYFSGSTIIRWTSIGFSAFLATASITGNPKDMLGTKTPSMTSK